MEEGLKEVRPYMLTKGQYTPSTQRTEYKLTVSWMFVSVITSEMLSMRLNSFNGQRAVSLSAVRRRLYVEGVVLIYIFSNSFQPRAPTTERNP